MRVVNTVTLIVTLEFAGAGPDANDVRKAVEEAIELSNDPKFWDLEEVSAQLAE